MWPTVEKKEPFDKKDLFALSIRSPARGAAASCEKT